MIAIGIGIFGVFLILLVAGTVPRLRNHRGLAVAAKDAQNTTTQVYVIRPEPAAEGGP